MPTTLANTELRNLRDRIIAGGLSEAIKVYGELYAQGYNYAGWGKGVATGSTVTGVSALDFLIGTSMMGVGLDACKNLTSAQIDKIRLDMAQGYVNALIDLANAPGAGGIVDRDIKFKEAEAFHIKAFQASGLSIDNWTLETPMSLIRKTQGDAAVELIWQQLRETGGSGPDSLIASTFLSLRVGALAFSSDSAIASAAQAWMDQTPGFANIQQVGKAVSAVVSSFMGTSSPDPLGAESGSAVLSAVTALTVTPTADGGATAVATIKAPATGITSIYNITTRPITSGAMAGRSFATTTNTQTGQVSYQLQTTSGTGPQGNTAANGNVSFYVDGTIYVFNGGTYIGVFDTSGNSGTLFGASGGQYSYDFTTGLIRNTVSTIGGVNVSGFTSTQTSANGSAWNAPVYVFTNVSSATAADHAAWDALSNGVVERDLFEDLVNASAAFLVNGSSALPRNPYDTPTPDWAVPIGAFYDSQSSRYDTAASIARDTPVLIDANSKAVTAVQLKALDTNKDGQLSLAESAGLRFWRDLDEQGQAGAGEIGNVDRVITSAEYELLTRGNARIAPVQASNLGAYRSVA